MLLSNCTPFHGTTEEELIEKIFEAKVTFDKPVWETVSPNAKSLLKKLLNARVKCCNFSHLSVVASPPAQVLTN